ncbi:Hydroxypyruvate reductase [subsurface metagenome]
MKILIADKTAEECFKKLKEFQGIEVTVRTGMTLKELIGEIKEYQGLIVRSATKVTAEVIKAGNKLKVIGRAGAGVDNIDVKAASENGIVVMNTPGGNAGAVAELVMGFMFALARKIPLANSSMKSGKWEKKSFTGTELSGKTLGIIGIGFVGAKVARKAMALGLKVLAYDPFVPSEKASEMGVDMTGLNELLEKSDFISVHVPKNEETGGFINCESFSKMKDGVIFINCSRGGIVVEKDLLRALEHGKVAGAGIDVYNKEPPADLSLVTHPHVIATPHIGASTKEAQIIVAEMIAEQIGRYLTKGELINTVNP